MQSIVKLRSLLLLALGAALGTTAYAQPGDDANPFKKVGPSVPKPVNPFQPLPGQNPTSENDLAARAQRAKAALEKNFPSIRATNAIERERTDPPPYRTWTDTDGHRIDARLAGVFAGIANLVTASGQTFRAPLSRLSKQDQAYLDSVREAASVKRRRSLSPADPQTTSVTQLETLGAAIDQMRRQVGYPFAFTVDRAGKPLLSWRVHLLRHVGGAELYSLFRRDEPWDSPHNLQLLPFMPSMYESTGSTAGPGKTKFLAVRGPRSVITVAKASLGSRGRTEIKRVRADDITDGLENTALVVEVPDEQAIEWTRPDDWDYSQPDMIQQLLSAHPAGFYSVLADGSVAFISNQNAIDTLKRLFDRADGRTLDLKWPKYD